MLITLGEHTCTFIPWRPELGQVFDSAFSFDTETTLIDDEQPELIPIYVLGAACDGESGYFVRREHVAEFFQAHPHLPVVFHNAAFDLDVLQQAIGRGEDLFKRVENNEVWDTLLLHKLLKLGEEGHVAFGKNMASLDTCALEYLGVDVPKGVCDSEGLQVRESYHKWLGKPPDEIEDVYLEYLARDVLATIQIYHVLQDRLSALLASSHVACGYVSDAWLMDQIERYGPQTHHTQIKASIVLKQTTANGLTVDEVSVKQLMEKLTARQQDLLSELREDHFIPGGKGSIKALQLILAKLEQENSDITLPRTPTGKYATTQDALEELTIEVPFLAKYLEYKSNEKLLSTYLGKMGKQTLHPQFNTLLTSGRTSSFGDINSQNLPKHGGVRECLVPLAGRIWIEVDYSTLELATLAQTVITQRGLASRMAELINAGADLHREFAAVVTGKPAHKVTKDERQKAKAINFGKPGGMGPKGLQRYAKSTFKLPLDEEEAESLSQQWLDQYPEMREYLSIRLDPGFELANLLGLSPEDFQNATGLSWFQNGELEDALKIMGHMCLKVTCDENPISSNTGLPYAPATIDYFWGALQTNLDVLPENLHADIQARRSSIDLYQQLRTYLGLGPIFTTTGRLRANAGYCQQKNTPFQGLAADGAKLALWQLWRAGYKIVNFIHDAVVVELPDTVDVKQEAENITRIMLEAMQEVVPDVTIRAEYKVIEHPHPEANGAAINNN